MSAPYIVNSYSVDYTTTGTSKNVDISYSAGDSIFVYATSDSSTSLSFGGISPFISTNSAPLSNNNATYGTILYVYAMYVTSGSGSSTITVNESSGTKQWGFTCLVIRNAFRMQLHNTATATSAAPLISSQTAFGPRALMLTIVTDSSAQNGSSRTWRTSYDTAPSAGNGRELTYQYVSGSYTSYAAYDITTSRAGTSFGLTSPSTMTYNIATFEFMGDDSVQSQAATSNAGYSASTTVTAQQVVSNAPQNRILLAAAYVGVQPANGTDTGVTTTMTFNSRPMTSIAKVHSNGGTQGYVELFYYINPEAGVNIPVVATASTSVDLRVSCRVMQNCNIADPFAEILSTTGSGTAPALSFSNVLEKDGLIGVLISKNDISGPNFSNTAKTYSWSIQNFNNSSDGGCAGMIDVSYPASTVSMGWPITSGPYAMIGVRLNPGGSFPQQAVFGFSA